ncbi:MAG: DUF493 family protein [Bacteroidales bacterium]|nr:DUF493 family protein [Bacteroidales bacterium]
MSSEFYAKLRKHLNNIHTWPSVYLFKFIIPDEPTRLTQVQQLFGEEASLDYTKSRKGNYISVSGKEVMFSADEVINRYKKAQTIEGVIML